MITLILPVREPVWILPVAKYVHFNYTFWDWRNSHRLGSGTHGTHCETNLR